MIRHVRLRLRLLQRWIRYFVLHNLLHADDPPHRLALGVAIGVFVTFTPTIGAQMALVVFFAWLFRANKVVGVPIVWITNPATLVPIYYPCYWLGRVILVQPGIGFAWWKELAHPPGGKWADIVFYWNRFAEVAVPLWVGCLVVATVLGYLSYRVTYAGICAYRMKRWGQLMPPAKLPRHRR